MQVTEIISHYGDVLQAIAYLLPEEVTKLMEDTAHVINLSLIANKKSYAALVRHLMIGKGIGSVVAMATQYTEHFIPVTLSYWSVCACNAVPRVS